MYVLCNVLRPYMYIYIQTYHIKELRYENMNAKKLVLRVDIVNALQRISIKIKIYIYTFNLTCISLFSYDLFLAKFENARRH